MYVLAASPSGRRARPLRDSEVARAGPRSTRLFYFGDHGMGLSVFSLALERSSHGLNSEVTMCIDTVADNTTEECAQRLT